VPEGVASGQGRWQVVSADKRDGVSNVSCSSRLCSQCLGLSTSCDTHVEVHDVEHFVRYMGRLLYYSGFAHMLFLSQ
jgi:hypothetical protein